MAESPLIQVLENDPEGRREWSASRIMQLADAAGVDLVGDIRVVSTRPAIKVGRDLGKSGQFAKRVVNGQTLWRLK